MAFPKSSNPSMAVMDVNPSDIRPLTNLEVYEFMKSRMQSKNKVRAQQTLLYTSMKFFNEKSPCTNQSSDEVRALCVALQQFNLSKDELLALINNCPTTQVELSIVRIHQLVG